MKKSLIGLVCCLFVFSGFVSAQDDYGYFDKGSAVEYMAKIEVKELPRSSRAEAVIKLYKEGMALADTARRAAQDVTLFSTFEEILVGQWEGERVPTKAEMPEQNWKQAYYEFFPDGTLTYVVESSKVVKKSWLALKDSDSSISRKEKTGTWEKIDDRTVSIFIGS